MFEETKLYKLGMIHAKLKQEHIFVAIDPSTMTHPLVGWHCLICATIFGSLPSMEVDWSSCYVGLLDLSNTCLARVSFASMIPRANSSLGGSCMPIVFQKDGSYLVGTLDGWTKKNPATLIKQSIVMIVHSKFHSKDKSNNVNWIGMLQFNLGL